MNYDKPQNDTENLSADELKLREMCRALKKTDAPTDFDFKLKARIASAKPSDFKPRYGFPLRYALPALAVILVLGLVVFNGAFFSSGNNSTIAESATPAPNPAAQPQSVTNFAPTPEVKQTDAMTAVSNTNVLKAPEESQSQVAGLQKPKKNLPKDKKDSGGGSIDSGVKYEKPLIPNINSNVPLPKSINTGQTNPMPVKDVLSFIGINAELEDGKWKVKSVTANSVGESSDVKVNDVIESIDNQPLATETINADRFSGKTLTVTRGGAKLQIRLGGKQ